METRASILYSEERIFWTRVRRRASKVTPAIWRRTPVRTKSTSTTEASTTPTTMAETLMKTFMSGRLTPTSQPERRTATGVVAWGC
ncbi:hypothetical protein IMZ48_24325 [Candidatus Bathyarchaeota archaeon]|nr:hypothetical protein [Candidatus Bathyarchaeota archaeon]